MIQRFCAALCEPRFANWDDYAQEVLKTEPKNATPIVFQGEVLGYEVSQYRYDPLKLFFISLLWRASVSTHEFYRNVNLGPFEAAAKALLDKMDPGCPQVFAVTLAKFDDPLGAAILDPHSEKWQGINYCRFYLSGYVAYVKTDRRPAPQPLSDFVMTPDERLKIIHRDLRRSPELALMGDIAKAAHNQLRFRQKL